MLARPCRSGLLRELSAERLRKRAALQPQCFCEAALNRLNSPYWEVPVPSTVVINERRRRCCEHFFLVEVACIQIASANIGHKCPKTQTASPMCRFSRVCTQLQPMHVCEKVARPVRRTYFLGQDHCLLVYLPTCNLHRGLGAETPDAKHLPRQFGSPCWGEVGSSGLFAGTVAFSK